MFITTDNLHEFKLFQWNKDGATEGNHEQQAEDGKTELSLIHFTVSKI